MKTFLGAGASRSRPSRRFRSPEYSTTTTDCAWLLAPTVHRLPSATPAIVEWPADSLTTTACLGPELLPTSIIGAIPIIPGGSVRKRHTHNIALSCLLQLL